MKIAMVTSSVGSNACRLATITLPIMTSYALQHNINFIVNTQSCENRHPAWSKVETLIKIIENYDWVWWIDLDIIIMNFHKSIRNLCKNSQKDVIVAVDYTGRLNTGSFFVKNTEFSKKFLINLWSKDEYAYSDLWENAAFIDLYNQDKELREKTEVISSNSINSMIPDYQAGDLLLHLAGGGDLTDPFDYNFRAAVLEALRRDFSNLDKIRNFPSDCPREDFVNFVYSLIHNKGNIEGSYER